MFTRDINSLKRANNEINAAIEIRYPTLGFYPNEREL